MKFRTTVLTLLILVLVGMLGLPALAGAQENPSEGQLAATATCISPNGNRFNLEPRANAVNQTARSVAFVLNGAGPGTDLVVETAVDARGLLGTLESEDAFYIQRSNSNCAADSEGGAPAFFNLLDTFIPFGSPVVAADPVRSTFFLADLRLGATTNESGFGVLRTTAANLLSATACPSGTQTNAATCWPTGNVVNLEPINFLLTDPAVAVDLRTTGTGAGDVYVAGAVENLQPFPPTRSVILAACTNSQVQCSNSVTVSGTDSFAGSAWVAVRPDGGITVTYINTTFGGFFPYNIKFVNCTPQGAPKTPVCSTPVLVTTEDNPVSGILPGNVFLTNGDATFAPGGITYPKHANRLETDGKTVTTFIVYDRCEVATIAPVDIGDHFCPKTDVAMTSSSDDGATWSPITSVTTSAGQQFFGTVATDASTETVNIAYYSTQNDPLQQHPQVFLAQIPPGSTTVGTPHLLTSAFADPQSQSPIVVMFDESFGNHLALAAAGTGASGQSHAYIGFTWNSAPGIYVGTINPDLNNHLTPFDF